MHHQTDILWNEIHGCLSHRTAVSSPAAASERTPAVDSLVLWTSHWKKKQSIVIKKYNGILNYIKLTFLVFIIAGITYCVSMLNCTAMCTSASHFFIWYNNSIVLRIRLHIHLRSTTFTSSRGGWGWRLEPPFSSTIPPKQLGMQKSPLWSTIYSEETLLYLLFSNAFLGQINYTDRKYCNYLKNLLQRITWRYQNIMQERESSL